MAEKYPKVRFAHCGGLWTEGKHPKNVGSYFGYIDECQYLNGIVAGHTSKTQEDRLHRRQADPAGAAQHQRVHAGRAQRRSEDHHASSIVTGDWSLPVKEAEAANSLIDQGVDVITCHVDSPKVVVETAEQRGIFVCGYHANQAALAPKGYLTGAEWNWVTPYTHARQGRAWPAQPIKNFVRGGLKEGFVEDVALRQARCPTRRKKRPTAIKAQMMKGDYVIFKGPLKDNTGKDSHRRRAPRTSRPTRCSSR